MGWAGGGGGAGARKGKKVERLTGKGIRHSAAPDVRLVAYASSRRFYTGWEVLQSAGKIQKSAGKPITPKPKGCYTQPGKERKGEEKGGGEGERRKEERKRGGKGDPYRCNLGEITPFGHRTYHNYRRDLLNAQKRTGAH